MTLEDLERVTPETTETETLTQYVQMLVGENENIKAQLTNLLDRQDRVGAVWAKFILALNNRYESKTS